MKSEWDQSGDIPDVVKALGRTRARTRAGLTVSIAMLSSLICAQSASASTVTLRPHDAADRVCMTVMGLEQGSAQHDQCVATLSRTASGLHQTDELVAARDLCSSRGLTSGPALAECELDRVDGRSPASSAASVAVELPDRTAGTYFHATPTMVLGRERRACAALGLEVGTGPFQACVAGLAGAMDAFIWTGGG